MKRLIAALFLAAFATASAAQSFGDGDPYRSSAGFSETDNVVQSYGG